MLLLGAAAFVLAWRLINGANYTQGDFVEYFTGASPDLNPSSLEWLVHRGESVANTFVPLVLPFAFPNDISINVVGGTSPPVIHFFFQYWNGLPFGIAIVFFPLLLLSLWRAFRLWPWPVFAAVIAPAVAFAIYWGSFHSGMLREGLQAWVLGLFVVVAPSNTGPGSRGSGRGRSEALLTLRTARGTAGRDRSRPGHDHVLVSSVFTVADVAAVVAMLGFSACLAAVVLVDVAGLRGSDAAPAARRRRG